MLKQLRLKNWRSIKEETIDFTPITVFIGANSSGKSNIIDALRFLREADDRSIRSAVYNRDGLDKILTNGVKSSRLELEFTHQFDSKTIISESTLQYHSNEDDFFEHTRILNQDGEMIVFQSSLVPPYRNLQTDKTQTPAQQAAIKYILTYIGRRWQILGEGFLPRMSITAKAESVNQDYALIEEQAKNLTLVLHFLRQNEPEIFNQIEQDAVFLLNHIEKIETQYDLLETKVIIREKSRPDLEAPVISTGTARAIAMITSY